jgi:HD-like signal output (HDOD) protein
MNGSGRSGFRPLVRDRNPEPAHFPARISLIPMPDAPKLRLLFVDDETAVLRMLQAMLRSMSKEWDMAFAESGELALQLMEQAPFDVIVSDMRMPGMNGAHLLNEVMKRHPRTVRIILSGYADEDLVMKCVGATHQYLTKPMDLGVLKTALKRIGALNERLANNNLRSLVAKLSSLPSMPAVYVQMVEALQTPDCPIERIGEIVAADPALTAKLLQLVNSAFFGFAREVSSVVEAIQMLGVGVIRSLALSVQLFSRFDHLVFKECSVDLIWSHSFQTGILARTLARIEGHDEKMMELAFTAGLLHDAGKLVLAANLPVPYRNVLDQARLRNCAVFVVEQEVFQATHADVGAFLLGIWGLPTALVEAVAFHHNPGASGDTQFSALTAVHAANVLCQGSQTSATDTALTPVDLDYLARLGLKDRMPIWSEAGTNV